MGLPLQRGGAPVAEEKPPRGCAMKSRGVPGRRLAGFTGTL